ncbi:MAG: zinc ribbon domain-containing protein [Lachnospiraceae bacterium]|nr:zinc ribbon domain-containing protein [Lachnospiraceae bacterium]
MDIFSEKKLKNSESDDIDSLVTGAETPESAPIDLTPDYPDTDAIKVTISDSVPETSDSELNSDKAKSEAALMGTVCPACGAPVVGSDSRFCISCGTPV